jgi:N-acetyl-gamma-glutamyl-phosphate reductase
VAIFGASGYSGLEATRLLASHPGVELVALSSDRWDGELAGKRSGVAGPAARLHYATHEKAIEQSRGAAAALLCTPAEASLELAPRLLALGVQVIDLSGAFRFPSRAEYEATYKHAHTAPELLAEAVYGMPELAEGVRAAVRAARLVANPGCYPTAATLGLAPLFAAGLLAPEAVVVDAASGTTGAGRKASEEMSFTEVGEEFRAYRVLRHQHQPEIAQALARAAGRAVPLTFTPHLLPVRRGILSTSYARLAAGRDPAELKAALLRAYAAEGAAEPFVGVLDSPEAVSLRAVVGTNRCEIGVACAPVGPDAGRVVVVAAIDNLVKGAAGQAIQNLNLLLGLDEAMGLLGLRAL